MGMATLGLVVGVALASDISQVLFGTSKDAELVAASFVGLWAGMNWTQLTNLFRVEERSAAFVSASIANILVTVGATLILVVALDKGPIGVIVGNFTGTLAVYAVLVLYRREQLGLEFDRELLRRMNTFGLPLVPSALFLWMTNFSDRIFLVKLADMHEVGLYSVGVRIASAIVLLLTAFRLAWPAFAYSIEDDASRAPHVRLRPDLSRRRHDVGGDGPRASLARGSCGGSRPNPTSSRRRAWSALSHSPRSRSPGTSSSRSVSGASRRTQFNWVVTGAAAMVNIALNLILIPPYGMMGAAVATIAAYTTMFVGMAWWSQRIYPVAYQWRRVGPPPPQASSSSRSASSPAAACPWPPCSRSPTRWRCSRSASTCRPSGGRSARGSGSLARPPTAASAAGGRR